MSKLKPYTAVITDEAALHVLNRIFFRARKHERQIIVNRIVTNALVKLYGGRSVKLSDLPAITGTDLQSIDRLFEKGVLWGRYKPQVIAEEAVPLTVVRTFLRRRDPIERPIAPVPEPPPRRVYKGRPKPLWLQAIEDRTLALCPEKPRKKRNQPLPPCSPSPQSPT